MKTELATRTGAALDKRLPLLTGLLLLVGASLYGDTPDTYDSTQQVAHYFAEHRVSIFWGNVLVTASLVGLLAVAARLASAFGPRTRVSRMVTSSSTVVVALMLGFVVILYNALSYIIGPDVPDMAKGLFELTLVATPTVAAPLAVLSFATAVGIRRTETGRSWFVIASVIAGAIFAMEVGAFARSGPFSPDVAQQVVYQTFAIWLILGNWGLRSPT